jgi:IPT/TIG domain-containing protein
VVVVALAFGALKLFGGAPLRLDGIEPKRVRVGQRATLTGSGFGSAPATQTVLFGDRAAKVLQAAPGRLEIEVPEAALSGDEGQVAVTVRAGSRASAPLEVTVYQGPRLHGLSPATAMPGEEVVLAGSGWGIGATVRFGQTPAQTVDVQSTQIRALVPDVGGPGTEAAVVVTVAGVDSNPAPFVVGHQPAAPAATAEPVSAAAVAAPAPTSIPAATPAPAPTPPPLQLDGNWAGSQVEQSQRTYLTVVFRGSSGSVAYEGGITFTVPMLTVEKPRRDQVRFSVQIRGGLRHYAGQWNGEAIAGSVSTDAAGKNVVATFELRKR